MFTVFTKMMLAKLNLLRRHYAGESPALQPGTTLCAFNSFTSVVYLSSQIPGFNPPHVKQCQDYQFKMKTYSRIK
jgi:hypothetical protein